MEHHEKTCLIGRFLITTTICMTQEGDSMSTMMGDGTAGKQEDFETIGRKAEVETIVHTGAWLTAGVQQVVKGTTVILAGGVGAIRQQMGDNIVEVEIEAAMMIWMVEARGIHEEIEDVLVDRKQQQAVGVEANRLTLTGVSVLEAEAIVKVPETHHEEVGGVHGDMRVVREERDIGMNTVGEIGVKVLLVRDRSTSDGTEASRWLWM